MKIPIIASLSVTFICILFPIITPLFLGLAVFLFLTNRMFTNQNFIVQDENNESFKKDINTIRTNQNTLLSEIQKVSRFIYGKNKENSRQVGKTKI